MNKQILVLNVGSSSFKWKLFSAQNLVELDSNSKNKLPLEKLLKSLSPNLKAIGHRIVHGGEKYFRETELNEEVISDLEKISHLAPLHNPPAIETIKKCRTILPNVSNYAVFDTSFFHYLPPKAYLYALPYELYQKHGIRRYGFHGISHEYVSKEAAKKLRKPISKLNLITVHLGQGASVTAIEQGKAVDTSMGFTPLEGLSMCTRSGDLDPAIIFYLVDQLGYSISKVEQLLYSQSGILGLSELSGDMRDILSSKEEKAILSIDVYCYRIRKYIGAYLAVLGNLDAVVFTGAIGFGSERIRKTVLKGFSQLENIPVFPIETNEELAIAQKII